jgi:thioredoxin-like negative regulator of GroEL
METIQSIQEFEQALAENDAILAYFSTENCSVCKVLKPKVIERITDEFPKMKMIFVESGKLPELAAQNRVFVAPTIIVFFAGRETIRKSRTFGMDELAKEIQRPYSLILN